MAGLLCLMAQAIPADPTPATVTQPDGQTLTVTLHGDEFFHFTTTSDGYTVVKNAAGFYTYARLDGDRLVASNTVARDEANRTAADRATLAKLPKGGIMHLISTMSFMSIYMKEDPSMEFNL